MQDIQPASQRFQTSEVAILEVYGRMGKLVAKMKNLSVTGAYLQLMEGGYVPTKGDVVHVVVQLRTLKKSRSVDAEVVWMNGLGFGINFLKKQDVVDRMFAQKKFL